MKSKNGLITFALIGLAVGATAYYLLGTEEGKKTLNNQKIKDIAKSLKDFTKKECKKSSKITKKIKGELEDITSQVKAKGRAAIDAVSSAAK
ncbi:hypothetical protein [Sphingobacterium rhinopitheci]|uniref:hypothetical protein n=1 Tax=Sphingobacterium rhinopitheci TaxID=2781960 RepID=UPI001F526DB6|nr:hypothetical protein [Sphingobacterium rhinopitheci]MCI0920830.1 hypothetical protein [Sphingobacterium rhinopitheci]